MEKKLAVIKVGGKIVEEETTLNRFLDDFSAFPGPKILVHGGGRSATAVASRLGIESKMIGGRRITDRETLEVVTMVYGGLVNKRIVAGLQARGVNALGMTGADLNLIRSVKRPVHEIDYGFVGDVKQVNGRLLELLVLEKMTPVMAPLTHDGCGNLLNTNADTIAAELAKALSDTFKVTLVYCFEKQGVLENEKDDRSVISRIDEKHFHHMIQTKSIKEGMIPKLENAFSAIHSGVSKVLITSFTDIEGKHGTLIEK